MIWNTSLNKAREINHDPSIYGTFAEIGAGQEVARLFFHAGQASKTVAKTMSAYDMVFSDEIYGKEPSGRYVCENRLMRMLDKEFSLLLRRLQKTRGLDSRFFAFADTVATGGTKAKPSHGWMGVRFQNKLGAEPSQVTLHAKLLDPHRLQQQETLGALGVDLIHACYFHNQSTQTFLKALTENIKLGSISIDMIRTEGPAFSDFNNQLLNLQLVQQNWTPAILINEKGLISPIGDFVFNRSLIVQRGHFNPVTKTHLDIMSKSLDFLTQDFKLNDPSLGLFELTTPLMMENDKINEALFLERVTMINQLGYPVMVSNFVEFYRLKEHLRQSTKQPISIVIPASHLEKLFTNAHYQDLPGGLLEGLGRLLDDNTHFYVYPHKSSNACLTASVFKIPSLDQKIFDYFSSKGHIKDLAGCDDIDHYIRSEEARIAISSKTKGWEQLLPAQIAKYIADKKLYFK